MPEPRINRVDELPRDIAPSRDLWPNIAARIESEGRQARRSRKPGAGWLAAGWSTWIGWVALAAVAAVGWGLYWQRPVPADPNAALLAALPPDARLAAEASLAEIRDSRARIMAAIERDRGDPQLQEMLVNNLHEEARVMRQIEDAGQLSKVM
jgi:hypothetical protein